MVLLALLLGGSSCDSFLDVQPKGEVLEGDLLKDAKGFENALYGVYAKMGSTNLYGQNLSYSALDLMAQYYTSTNNEEVEPLIKYDYTNTKAEDLFYNIWCVLSVFREHRAVLPVEFPEITDFSVREFHKMLNFLT